MKDFVITCSSTCDLNPYYLRQHNMYYVSFYYYLDDDKFYDDFYKDHSIEEYYEKIKTCKVKTSQPDPEQYKELWIKLIKQGFDILHVELSSGISGAVNSSLIAKSMVEDEYPYSKIYVVDSITASSGFGLLLDKIYEFKNNNNDIDKCFEYAEKTKHNINAIFLVENLDQLIKGGRVSKISGNIGKILNIVPILHVDEAGKLGTIKKARGLVNAMNDIISLMETNINPNTKIFINNAHCLENTNKIADKIRNKFNNIDFPDENIFNIGTVIGGHTGNGCIAVFYEGNGRV